MSAIEMACAKLSQALKNKSAQERYTTMTNPKFCHPGWVNKKQKLIGGTYGEVIINKR